MVPSAASPRLLSRLRLQLRRSEGAALVELALTLPVLFLLLFGAAVFGRLAYAAIEVSNAARAGAAYGAQSIATAMDSAGISYAALNDGADIRLVQPVNLAASSTLICQCANGAVQSCSSAATSCPTRHILKFIQVNTSATVNPGAHIPGLPQNWALTGQSTMQVADQ